MGLASRLTHALVLTDLNRSLSHSARYTTYTSVPVPWRHLLGSFNGPEPGVTQYDDKKVKEGKRERDKKRPGDLSSDGAKVL